MGGMNFRFVFRGIVLGVPFALIALSVGLAVLFLTGRLAPPPDPTPPPPTITVPAGALPDGPIGMREWVRYRGEGWAAMSCGFMFRLQDGREIGAIPAHSHSLGEIGRPLELVGFGLPGDGRIVAEFDTLHGLPGTPRTSLDLRVDYVLLQTDAEIDPYFVLEPDPRGRPQPGERVALFSGLGGGDGPDGRRMLRGTVQTVTDDGVWILMDDWFNPTSMSGSPVMSEYTGKVVGMLLAGTLRGKQLLLGVNPIRNLVEQAEQAAGSRPLRDLVQ